MVVHASSAARLSSPGCIARPVASLLHRFALDAESKLRLSVRAAQGRARAAREHHAARGLVRRQPGDLRLGSGITALVALRASPLRATPNARLLQVLARATLCSNWAVERTAFQSAAQRPIWGHIVDMSKNVPSRCNCLRKRASGAATTVHPQYVCFGISGWMFRRHTSEASWVTPSSLAASSP